MIVDIDQALYDFSVTNELNYVNIINLVKDINNTMVKYYHHVHNIMSNLVFLQLDRSCEN